MVLNPSTCNLLRPWYDMISKRFNYTILKNRFCIDFITSFEFTVLGDHTNNYGIIIKNIKRTYAKYTVTNTNRYLKLLQIRIIQPNMDEADFLSTCAVQ